MEFILKMIFLISSLIGILLIGSIAYHELEGWNYLDSLYFTTATVTTIGYGDLYPTTDMSKIFTIVFAFAGIGIALFTLTSVGQHYFERKQEIIGKKLEKRIIKYVKKRERKIEATKRKIIRGSKV